MPVVADTAYPRLAANPRPAELEEAFTPTEVELSFASQRTRRAGPRLALLVLLKTFQRLGHFVLLADVPHPIVARVASAASLSRVTEELASYDSTTYRVQLMALVRGFVGVAGYATARLAPSPSRRACGRRALAMTSPTSSMPRLRSSCGSATNCRPSAPF